MFKSDLYFIFGSFIMDMRTQQEFFSRGKRETGNSIALVCAYTMISFHIVQHISKRGWVVVGGDTALFYMGFNLNILFQALIEKILGLKRSCFVCNFRLAFCFMRMNWFRKCYFYVECL